MAQAQFCSTKTDSREAFATVLIALPLRTDIAWGLCFDSPAVE